MPICECGCGEETQKGHFKSGHDQKLRASLESDVGGILALRSLVNISKAYARGSISEFELTQTIRALISEADRN